jgi:hypothetical protein
MDIVAAGLFDENVLARLASPDRPQGVPMIRCRDRHGVDVAALQQLLLVLIGRRPVTEGLLHVGGPLAKDVQVDIAERGDPHARHGPESVDVVLAAAVDANDRQIDAIVGARDAGCGARRGQGGKPGGESPEDKGVGGHPAAAPEKPPSGDGYPVGHVDPPSYWPREPDYSFDGLGFQGGATAPARR